MAILKDILYKVPITSTSGSTDVDINAICFDSRKVKEGSLFIAIKGTQSDGHGFIDKAVSLGAVAIVVEKLPELISDKATYVAVKDSAQALGIIASNFYGNPSGKLKLVGVTGTNGKTTVATLLYKLFSSLGYRCGMLSTVVNKIVDKDFASTHTTPDPIQINELLVSMLEAGCTHCFMEVSSHAVAQGRIAGLHFVGALFTNITHDHLDYHRTFESYIRAKKGFFDGLSSDAFALVNIDDKRGMVMLQNTKAQKKTFALKKMADYKAKIITNSIEGLELEIGERNVWFKLIGDFNAYNLLTVYGAACLMGEDSDTILLKLSALTTAPGRFELVLPGSKFTAIVDYAHTPDALKNVLETIEHFRTGQEQVIAVVGCGGDRDKTKRPLMAAVACKYSNKVIFTSDNPRSEDPLEIIKEMQTGVGPTDAKKTLVMVDREEAIKTACMLAKEKDIIIVAGKGHENYQEIKGVKHPFDDKEVLTRMLKMFAN
ncbi:MAG: UDP-N-acetylmuramoyl-L-alanyl-D-glutamate--2,6-diaminopimelate ligase [Cytophagales bacterium]|jgi:UDP-N-acetylmuramoyl-L-alanyl-D-glutamate--2,6-diaminopimelate ligase|nr:UDP-N-acetylmuramoyl-L-alanyl-D-glutamate--2,6-diaminopimelate ligase [Cytophagales bacterium]MCA6386883.1 UDP-N-acetylmuramoyl-L-alanyl-D-glutamate--2,6-diaminopimelate ligase [Cytophagales bacterium]MCA6390816.1 UDP-N-acetylmuramoyl-L-alanyl-D-glutamate--2,6-diaminopimelate ligase [Cytophagales bacterium]MCA6396249.1 UDP-N-acetylmuramoyl-L-alanyl-D-glutamate--2,6-diaminopimelate ligase [Cytophagales bacterium]MCA6397568.1 UDP-N-acetylmuramoyl-L-alanyl-D-glutamate--2,6-diaminopimelate ligas